MENKHKSAFDESVESLEQRLETTRQLVVRESLDMGLYLSYRDEHCTSPDEFVHEYKDGRKELIRINPETGKEELLKTF